MQARSYADLYASVEAKERVRRDKEADERMLKGALESTAHATSASESSGFQRMAMCRKALEALDRRGWDRSYHQRYFHDNFIRACARVFWKVRVLSRHLPPLPLPPGVHSLSGTGPVPQRGVHLG